MKVWTKTRMQPQFIQMGEVRLSELSLFEPKLCAMRWTRYYYRNSHRVFSSNVGTYMFLP